MPEVRLDEHTIEAIASQLCEVADKSLKPLLRLAEKIAENTALAALRQKEWLSQNEVATLLGTSDTTLRKSGVLNDLRSQAYLPEKLNGYRLSKSPKSMWKFRRKEFERFGPTLHGGDVDHEPSANGDIDIRPA